MPENCSSLESAARSEFRPMVRSPRRGQGCCVIGSPTTSGIWSKVSSRPWRRPDARRATAGRCSTVSFGSSAPARPGVTCPRSSVPGALSQQRTMAMGWRQGLLDQILNCLRSAPFRHRRDRSGIVVHRRHSRPRPAVPRGAEKGDPEEPTDHALGRSRGGFTTKIHLLCDGNGHPLQFQLTAGQAHENTALLPLLQAADETRSPTSREIRSPGRWPWLAISGYRADWIDEALIELLHPPGRRPVEGK